MTWEIVLGLSILVGSLVTLGGVLTKLVRTLTRLDVTLAAIDKSTSENRLENEQDHKEFRNELKEHEIRIVSIEKERKKN